MPSSTFYNLPEEKREKLLDAAVEEFGRVPYEKASINKMIHTAGIPRGSFYMYFTDKEDLFRHLMKLPTEKVTARMEETLEGRGGDIFAAGLDFYDQAIASFCRQKENPLFKKITSILMKNPSMGQGLLNQGQSEILQRLGAKVDHSRLDLRKEGDLEIMLKLLLGLVASSVMAGICSSDLEKGREQFIDSLDILRRGMEKAPQSAV